MQTKLHYFIFIPIVSFILSLLIPAKREKLISNLTVYSIALNLLLGTMYIFTWIINGAPQINQKDIVLFQNSNLEFFLDFSFDKTAAVYFFVGSFLTFVVTYFSSHYMHREEGFKRFFNTIMIFYIGYNLIVFSGNLETLFIGWETIGLTSFLLIAFYRNRYLPVKNAVKVFSIYRIGDIGIFLAMWLSHHLFHRNITFNQAGNAEFLASELQSQTLIGIVISFVILISASAKSAQLPFSSWLPRAMEGPTPSSAIFYGSLSVHIGVFLMLRTFSYWENQTVVRILMGTLGFVTAVLASLSARVQSAIKTKIAYASISQIGIMFVELSFGWTDLVLLHFVGNAFLRTYQLLISPSVVTYLIRDQFYNFSPKANSMRLIPKKIRNSIYIWSVKEWNLGRFMNRFYWEPLKWAGNRLNFLNVKLLSALMVIIFSTGMMFLFFPEVVSEKAYHYLPDFFSFIGLLLVLKSFSERKDTLMSWGLIITSHFFIALAISFNEHFNYSQTFIYLSGIIVSGGIGLTILLRLKNGEKIISLDQFRGHVYEHPYLAFIFLLCCLGVEGFPITPTFIGEELIFDHVHDSQFLLAFFTAASFIVIGLSAIRIYARLFLGPHVKTYHEIAYRSS